MRIPVGSILILAALQLRDRQWSHNMPKGTVERAQNKLYSEILDSFKGKKTPFQTRLVLRTAPGKGGRRTRVAVPR